MKPKFLCLLMCLGSTPPAVALGLGDLEVRSALGQPLHATIRIIEPGTAVTADCFTLQPAADAVAPLPGTQLDLERRGSHTLLHIRSPRAIGDPIVQFALTSECETRLRRDYVLLLDPPVAAQAPLLGDTPPTVAPIAAAPRAPVSLPPARPAKRTRHTPAAASGHAMAAPRAHAAAAPAPRLVLSGRRLATVGESGMALRLDTALPDLNRPRSEPLTTTELSDENTALTRKLAHLESQLAALQQRNAELEARKGTPAATPANVTPAAAKGRPQWPLYLLLAGLLGSAGGLIAWMRRGRRPALNLPDDEWHAHPPIPPRTPAPASDEWPDTVDASPGEAIVTAPTIAPVAGSPVRPESTRRIEPAFDLRTADDNTEVKDDILDQAEVFMAHGHGDLAIHLLQEHLREAPDESPVPWLLLLDLLHRAGDSTGYAATAAQCRRHYNIDLSRPPVSQDAEAERGPGLEAYPHVTERLVHVWHSTEVDNFFRELIYDNRGGSRIGFEPGAYRDILLLRALAHETLPDVAGAPAFFTKASP